MTRDPHPAPQGPTFPATAPGGGGRRGRVLVADDDPMIQLVTATTLALLGYDADLVANGREAVEAVSRNQYLAVLMDCQMPELDGYQATAEIRRVEAGSSHTPIIALTATPIDNGRQACLAAGMDDHLSKPARKEAIEAALQRWGRPPSQGSSSERPGPAP